MNRIKLTLTVLLLTALTLPVVTVHANVPTILSITRRTDSGNTLIDVKVNHADPTAAHYISQITLDLDGTTKTLTDLIKAITPETTYTLNIGATSPKTIKAQATCNLHGPSAWFTEAGSTIGGTGGTTSSGVPSYSLEATIIGAVIAVAALLARKR